VSISLVNNGTAGVHSGPQDSICCRVAASSSATTDTVFQTAEANGCHARKWLLCPSLPSSSARRPYRAGVDPDNSCCCTFMHAQGCLQAPCNGEVGGCQQHRCAYDAHFCTRCQQCCCHTEAAGLLQVGRDCVIDGTRLLLHHQPLTMCWGLSGPGCKR
jgi:hypothetical protein